VTEETEETGETEQTEETWSRSVAQVSRLVFEYSDRIDSGDLEGLADILAEAGFGTFEDPLLRGRDRILALYRSTVRIYEDGTPRTHHVVTNLVVELDETAGTATSRSYFTVLQAHPPGSITPIVAGRYHDRFARRDKSAERGGDWYFTERRISMDLVGDVTAHMLPAAQHLVSGGGAKP
jgi:SnoaL-like domain